MNKTTNTAQTPPSMTLRLSRGRSIKITWRPRQRISSLLVKLLTKALAIFLPLSMGYAHAADVNALPTGGRVSAGKATINQTGNTLNINQTSQKAALNWQNFNIGSNSTVNFVQPNSNAVALNRIGGNAASEIYGHLNANGQVFLMNPNGILFGRGSQVNVGGIVATTMQLGDADFLAGNYNFNNAGAGSVANYGLINATNSVALLGGDVSNQGSIFATTASLVSGNTVALDVSTDGLIRARVVDVAMQANIANSGDINATQVTLSAGQAKDALNRVVNNSGVIKATGFSSLNGEIVLQGGTTLNSGRLDATSATGNGGAVHMLGQHVGVVDSGSIDVSGATGGGTILVGGDYQGKNTNIENAEVTYVGAQTTLKADATQNGNGGKVILWADDTTRAYGSISAQSGALGGDGGFVETSGKQVLDVAGINVNAGVGGQWLLDPDAITILHQTGGNSFGSIYDPSGVVSTISDSSINAAINAGSSVTIQTTILDGTGDITFDGSSGSGTGAIVIDKNSNSNSTLTINAYGKIVFKGDTTIQTSGSGGNLALVLMPDGQNVGGGNKINTSSSSTLTLNGAVGEVEVMIGGVNNVNTRGTWDNEGTVTLNGNSAIRFYDNGSGTRVGSFHNMPSTGILSINSSSGWSLLTATAPFVAGSSSQAGLVTNDGTINVNGTNGGSGDYTAWAILYNQGTTGVLNIGTSGASRTLSMQNGGAINGTISIANSAGKLNVSENHGVTSFSNLTFSGTGGTLNVSGTVGGTPTATFGGVKAPNVTLNIGVFSVPAGNVTISGNSIFNNVNYNSGTFAISNAKLGIAGGAFIVPAGVTYLGNVGYLAKGDLTIANPISTTGNVTLMAGWNENISTPAVTSSNPGALIINAAVSALGTGGTLNLASSQGITSGAGGVITATSLTANAAGAITLQNSNNDVDDFSAANSASSQISYWDIDALSLGSLTTLGNIGVKTISELLSTTQSISGANVDLIGAYGISIGGNLTATGTLGLTTGSTLGSINQTAGNIVATGVTTVNSIDDLILTSTGNNFSSISLTGRIIKVRDFDAMTVTTLSRSGSKELSLVAGGALSMPAGLITTDSYNLTLSSGANFTTPGILQGANISLSSTGDLTLGDYVVGTGNVTLDAGHDIFISNHYIDAMTGMTVTAGHDINLTATSAPVQLLTDSGDQNITAGNNISLTACATSCGGGRYADIVHGTGTGNQTIDLINGGTLTLTGGIGSSQNFAQIDNKGTSGSIQKIWSSRGSGFYPTIVMNGGASGGAAGTTGGIDNANIAEIDSDISQQIYANTITMTGGAGDYAGAIISAPTQLITTTGNVTLTGGSSTNTASGTGDTFTYKGVAYTVASPAAIGDKNNLSQTLTIGGTLTLNGGNGSASTGFETSRMAMVGSLNGLATGSVKANAIVLNSGASAYSLAMLGGVKDIVVTSTFANSGVTSGFISGNAWSIWAPNPTAITGCGSGTGCLASFAQYGANFASNPTVLGTGNGLMYSDTLSLTSTLGGAVTKVYNGSNAISLTGATFGALQASPADSLGGPFYNDVISPVTITGGTGTLSSINVGTGISVTATGMTVTGIKTSSATGSIPVYGYSFTASGNIGEVTPAPASPISLSGSRVYDGTNIVDASIFSLSGLVGSETLTLSGSGTVADKKVGNNKPVSLGSLTLGNGSGSASNYTFTGGTWLASITPASISVSGITAADRAYNSTTAATLNTSGITFGGLITGDVLSVSATGAFINKNVGVGKTVNISGIALTGTDAGNYTLASSTATTTATISPAALAISGAVADNKVYDGTTSANLSSVGSITGVFSGDSLGNVTGATAAFSDREIGAAKLVNFSLLFDGIDANNYMASGTTTANITKASSSTDDVVNVITDLTQPENYDTQGNQDTNQGNQDNTQAKQSEQDDTVTRGVLEVLSGFENNQTEKEAPITEQPKGRTLQCSFNK